MVEGIRPGKEMEKGGGADALIWHLLTRCETDVYLFPSLSLFFFLSFSFSFLFHFLTHNNNNLANRFPSAPPSPPTESHPPENAFKLNFTIN